MARIQVFVAIEADRGLVFDLIRDRAQRHRFMPEGWKVTRLISNVTDEPGATMEIEWKIGPRPVRQVVQLIDVTDAQVIEAPPPGDNYVSTWTVGEDEQATLVGLEMQFSYGDILGEWFVKRRLRGALRQQLDRLRDLAEGIEKKDRRER